MMLEDALFERRLFLGLQLPNRPEHPDYPEFKAQIADAVRYWEKRIAATLWQMQVSPDTIGCAPETRDDGGNRHDGS